ncbi:MAG: hypothetical protein ACFFAE_18640, partial [Candidatus Hodarchaeota archaeon]
MAILEDQISNEYLRFLIILIGTIIFVSISYLILKLIVNKISEGKKSYSKFILKQLSIPIFFLVFIIGLYTSLKTLSRLDEYYLLIDDTFFIITTLVFALLASRIITVITMGWLKVRRGFKRTPGLLNKAITV